MGEGVVSIDKGIVEKLMELREPGADSLCKHDWVGDDDCVYCRNEKLERQIDVERMETLEQLAEKDARIAKLTDSLSCCNAWLDNCTDRYDKLEADTDAEIEQLKNQLLRTLPIGFG